MKKKILCVLSAGLLCVLNTTVFAASDKNASDPPALNGYTTFLALPNIYYSDVGATYALNRNLSTDGWLLRGQMYGGYYTYDYNSGGKLLTQEGTYLGGLVMSGYQWYFNKDAVFSFYGGLEAREYRDTLTGVEMRGSRFGANGTAELFLPFDESFYGYSKIYFSSVWNTYSFMGKLGYKVNSKISFGPEIGAIGHECLGTQRAGGFVSYNVLDNVQLVGSVGYNVDTRPVSPNTYSGVYGMLYVGLVY